MVSIPNISRVTDSSLKIVNDSKFYECIVILLKCYLTSILLNLHRNCRIDCSLNYGSEGKTTQFFGLAVLACKVRPKLSELTHESQSNIPTIDFVDTITNQYCIISTWAYDSNFEMHYDSVRVVRLYKLRITSRISFNCVINVIAEHAMPLARCL